MDIIENKIKTNQYKSEDETGEGFSIHKFDTVCKRHEVAAEKMELEAALIEAVFEVQIEDDTICQLDGAADPVTCNICQQCFYGKNKCIKLTSHKINYHFNDDFRRAVKDESRKDGYFHCEEDNCTAKHKQKADMFRHLATVHKYLDKFSNRVTFRSLSVLVSQAQAPAPAPEQIPDLITLPGSHQEQERGSQSLTQTSSATENCQQTLLGACVSAGDSKVRSRRAAETYQGIMLQLSLLLFNLYLFTIQSLSQLHWSDVMKMVQ